MRLGTTMREIHTKSTSRTTAQVDDIELRVSDTVRLVFRPTIVENHKLPEAAVKGVFLYQRKSKTNEWEDFNTIKLNSVKSGEGYKLEIKSEELLSLMQQLRPLYQIKQKQGIPRGNRTYVELTPQLQQLQNLAREDISEVLNANRSLGGSLLSKLLSWSLSLDEPDALINRLVELDANSLSKLNAALGLYRLKAALEIWEENSHNNDEEFWQRTLTDHSFVLEQVFAWPTAIVKDKAYVGGKNVLNQRGNVVDFLVRNRLTQSAALVEIKTPGTQLLGRVYRQTYNVSSELSGSIMQTLNYKQSLQENYKSLNHGNADLFDSFDPQCAVIIGSSQQLDTQDKRRAFELYRHQFPGLAVIPFDELFEKTRKLVELLEAKPTEEIPDFDDDIPF